jgi:hypothetical protein
MKPKPFHIAIVAAAMLFFTIQCVSIKHIDSPDIAAAEPGTAQRELPTPVPLTPGQVIRIQITPSGTSSGGTGKQEIILRIQLESSTGTVNPDGPTKPTPPATGLEKELADLYDKDTDQDKAKHAKALGDLYTWAASALRQQGGTSGGFRKALGTKSSQLLPTDVLLPLRQRVATELRTVLPKPADTQLDDATREAAAKMFDRLAAAMNSITSR